MSFTPRSSRSPESRIKRAKLDLHTPRRLSNAPHLTVPLLTPIPLYRVSPALDEFSLRKTPSRGGTASPAPAKGVRKRLHQYRNFDHAVDLLKSCTNIVVLTGAGISTSVGIPDFRSDKGLYSQLSKNLGITEAEEFFSRDYFVHNTGEFFQYVKRVIPEAVLGTDGTYMMTNSLKKSDGTAATVPEFSLTHAFLALLHWKHKLLTNYTQNIDGLEIAAGVPQTKFIQCHGSWDTASCMTCGKTSSAKRYLPIVFAGNIPFCKCKVEAERQNKRKRKMKSGKKRSWEDFESDHSSDDGTRAPRGLLKPNITFFNERLSGDYGHRLDEDKRKIDLLIIIGTSLKVGPVQDMLYQISPKVPQIFISKERFSGALCNLPGVQVDIELLGECDVIIEELCRRAGWLEELENLCWEKGQLKIKSLEPHVALRQHNAEIQADYTEQFRDEVRIAETGVLEVPGKQNRHTINIWKTASYVEEMEERDPEAATANLNGPDDNAYAALKVTENLTAPLTTEYRRAEPEQNSAATNHPPVRQQPSVSSDSDDTGLNKDVRIELVEGTSHQWRVSKR